MTLSSAGHLVVGYALASVIAITAACTPDARKAIAPAVGPAVRASCVLLRALLKDGTTSEVCATADELAPLVEEILSSRAVSPAVAAAAPHEVAVLPVPIVPVARRRCVSWAPVASSRDAGSGADSGQ